MAGERRELRMLHTTVEELNFSLKFLEDGRFFEEEMDWRRFRVQVECSRQSHFEKVHVYKMSAECEAMAVAEQRTCLRIQWHGRAKASADLDRIILIIVSYKYTHCTNMKCCLYVRACMLQVSTARNCKDREWNILCLRQGCRPRFWKSLIWTSLWQLTETVRILQGRDSDLASTMVWNSPWPWQGCSADLASEIAWNGPCTLWWGFGSQVQVQDKKSRNLALASVWNSPNTLRKGFRPRFWKGLN